MLITTKLLFAMCRKKIPDTHAATPFDLRVHIDELHPEPFGQRPANRTFATPHVSHQKQQHKQLPLSDLSSNQATPNPSNSKITKFLQSANALAVKTAPSEVAPRWAAAFRR